MVLFDDIINEIRGFVDGMGDRQVKEFNLNRPAPWPEGKNGSVILKGDTGIELGSPEVESASFIIWTEDGSLVRDGRMTLIGPDIYHAKEPVLPLGKAVIAKVTGFDENNSYRRYREMELARYDVSAEGYMMRAVSQHMREWCRVSRDALQKKLSLAVIGARLARLMKNFDYVDGVEVFYVTSGPGDVRALREIGERAVRYISAMNRMTEELDFDCGSCEYVDICSEVDGLRKMRDSLMKETGDAAHGP